MEMSRKVISYAAFFLLFTSGITSCAAQTLQETLEIANVPIKQFPSAALDAKITSHAISADDPFLLAYYVDDGSGILHIVRYDYAKRDLRRAELGETNALFK